MNQAIQEFNELCSTGSLTAAKLRDLLCQGHAPTLRNELQSRAGVTERIPSAQAIGLALRQLADETGALKRAVGHRKLGKWSPQATPDEPLQTVVEPPKPETVQSTADPPERFAELLKATKTPIGFSDLCDRLNLPPSRCAALVEAAQDAGLYIEVAHDHVQFRVPDPDPLDIATVGPAPVVGGRHVIAVASDLHFGSRYTMRQHIQEFYHIAYEAGARQVFCPGDILDGVYKKRIHELSHYGIDEQTDDAIETIPRLQGMTTHAITGNHDSTYTATTGIRVGDFIENRFRSRGRTDFLCYGPAQKFIMVGSVKIELWHPALTRGNQYAGSYSTERHIDAGYALGTKPQISLIGHLHRFIDLTRRGIHAVLCPCFQAPGSEFSKWLGYPPANGGLILSWELTADNTIRRFACEQVSYYLPEVPQSLRN